MDIKRDLELMYELGCLRNQKRNWVQFLNPDVQNNTEHTFRVMWLALVIANHEKVGDHEKIIKMALVHDICESRSNDVNLLTRQYVSRDEEKSMKHILHDTVFQEEMMSIWEEYEKRESIEAKIVKDADNLDCDLELKEQEARGHSLRKQLAEMRQIVINEGLHTETAKKLWHEIQGSNPHDWHWNGETRLKVGDKFQ